MKKYCILLVCFSIVRVGVVSADCNYYEIEPVCGINGQTFTNSCQGWSDTSSWNMPVGYEGACLSYPELSPSVETKIKTVMGKILEPYLDDDSIYAPDVVLNEQGIIYINKVLFPVLTKLIQKEVEKTDPNFYRLAILHTIASLIGYDYVFSAVDS